METDSGAKHLPSQPPEPSLPRPPLLPPAGPPLQLAPSIAMDAPLPLSVLSTVVKPEPKGPRPIASVPVVGTPWSVVWSSDERTFFFNATNRTSVWSIPEELEGNEALEKVLDNPPGGKSEHVATKETWYCLLLYNVVHSLNLQHHVSMTFPCVSIVFGCLGSILELTSIVGLSYSNEIRCLLLPLPPLPPPPSPHRAPR